MLSSYLCIGLCSVVMMSLTSTTATQGIDRNPLRDSLSEHERVLTTRFGIESPCLGILYFGVDPACGPGAAEESQSSAAAALSSPSPSSPSLSFASPASVDASRRPPPTTADDGLDDFCRLTDAVAGCSRGLGLDGSSIVARCSGDECVSEWSQHVSRCAMEALGLGLRSREVVGSCQSRPEAASSSRACDTIDPWAWADISRPRLLYRVPGGEKITPLDGGEEEPSCGAAGVERKPSVAPKWHHVRNANNIESLKDVVGDCGGGADGSTDVECGENASTDEVCQAQDRENVKEELKRSDASAGSRLRHSCKPALPAGGSVSRVVLCKDGGPRLGIVISLGKGPGSVDGQDRGSETDFHCVMDAECGVCFRGTFICYREVVISEDGQADKRVEASEIMEGLAGPVGGNDVEEERKEHTVVKEEKKGRFNDDGFLYIMKMGILYVAALLLLLL